MKNQIFLFLAVLGFAVNAVAQREVPNNSSTDYSKSRVYFTNDVSDDGTIGDEGTVYNINKKKGSYVYCIVSNYPSPLGIEEFSVDIYKGSKFVENKAFNISNTTKTTYFKYTFHEKGEYKFVVKTGDGKTINTGYVTIKYQ
jgi:hypothetical protein